MDFEIADLEHYLTDNPEDAAMSPKLWSEIVARSEEALTYYRAVDAYEAGDEGPLREWIKSRGGVESDVLLDSVLRLYYLAHGGSMPYPFVYRLVSHHGERLKAADPGAWYVGYSEVIYDRLDKKPQYALMRSLREHTRPFEVLRTSLPGALLQAEADGFWGGTHGDALDSLMLGAVEKIIVEDNRPLRDMRKRLRWIDPLSGEDREMDKIVSLDGFPWDAADIYADLRVETEYEGVEDADLLDSMISHAALSPAEADVLDLLSWDFTPEEVAHERGINHTTVYVHLRNIRLKLAATA